MTLTGAGAMDPADREILLAAFDRPVAERFACDCRLLLRGQVDAATDSYMTVSWDRYFRDLSFGSYRDFLGETEKAWRSRVWHFLFKNLKLVERIFRHPGEAVRVLDVGCSSGYLRRLIEGNASPSDSKRVFYWGVDVREDRLRSAVEAVDDVESGAAGGFAPSAFLQHDLKYGLPFKDDWFDIVVNFEMIKYLPIPQGAALLRDSRRVLKPAGEFYLSVTDYTPLKHQGREDYMRALLPARVGEMLGEAGFEVLERFGSQVRPARLAAHIRPAHRPLVEDLLRHHPPELVAAMIGPLYPDQADQVTFRARPRG